MTTLSTHLVDEDRSLELIDEPDDSLGILGLIEGPIHPSFPQQCFSPLLNVTQGPTGDQSDTRRDSWDVARTLPAVFVSPPPHYPWHRPSSGCVPIWPPNHSGPLTYLSPPGFAVKNPSVKRRDIIQRERTSWCFMSALMPPRHDLRGGSASADSFATSKSTFVPSIRRCFFAAGNQRDRNHVDRRESYKNLVQVPPSLSSNVV